MVSGEELFEESSVGAVTLVDDRRPRVPIHMAHVDGLRGGAALFVMCHHMFQLSRLEHPELTTPWLLVPLQYGHFAVSLFIVISGFSLMLPVLRAGTVLPRGALDFFKRRARRILPTYYFAVALSLAMIAAGIDTFSIKLTPGGVLAHLLLAQNLVPEAEHQVNLVFWSIAVESQIYLLFPLLILAWRRFGGIAATLGIAITAYLLAYAVHPSRWDGLHLQYVALFAVGMAAAAVATSPEAQWVWLRTHVPWKTIALVVTAAIGMACYRLQFAPERLCDAGIGVVGAALVIAPLLVANRKLRAVLSWRPLVFVGTFAYSVYLVHLPLLGLCYRSGLLPSRHGGNAVFLLLLGVASWFVLIGCYAFYWVCERPFISSPTRNITSAREYR